MVVKTKIEKRTLKMENDKDNKHNKKLKYKNINYIL